MITVKLYPLNNDDKIHGPMKVKKFQVTDWDFKAILADNTVIWITFGNTKYVLNAEFLPE